MATIDDIVTSAARFAPITAAAFPRTWQPRSDGASVIRDEQDRLEAIVVPKALGGGPEDPHAWAVWGLAPGSGEHGEAKDEEVAKALAGAAVARLRAAEVAK